MTCLDRISTRILASVLAAWGLGACRPDEGSQRDATTDDTSGGVGTTTEVGASTGAVESSSSTESTRGEPMGCPSGPAPVTRTGAVEPGTLVADPLAPFPADLSDVGIYPDAPDLSVVPDVAIHYVPAWPLWSNGSGKHRYLVLPPDATIDASDPPAWVLPTGALMFKTFLFDDGVDGCPRPVETRVMRKASDGTWDYAVYGWDKAGVTGQRLDIGDRVPIEVTGDEGPFVHHVPARIECRACHESSWGDALGVERLQLSTPLGEASQPQLDAWWERGLLSDPVSSQIIEHDDEATRQVLGMFAGNCVHCHNGSGGPSSSFDLRHDVALANTIDQPTESSASASGIRIVSGTPEQSILFLAFSGETNDPEVEPMPPVGVDVRDAAAVELLRAFISALEDGR
jgi:hypothetical protein